MNMARLRLITDEKKPILEIRDETFSIGRLPENHLVLTDSLVSRKHAEIKKVGQGWRIVDHNSLNGIYVNNLKVEDEKLAHGAVIAIGEAKLLFEIHADPAGPAAAPGFQANVMGLAEREIIKPLSHIDPNSEFEIFSISDALKPGGHDAPAARIEPARSRNFFILYQVARALNSANSLDELLELTMNLVLQVVNAERGVVFLYNRRKELEPVLSKNRKSGEPPELTVSRTITQKAIDEKSAIITADACYDPRFADGASIIAYNIRSALCAPLWDQDTIRGAIYLDNLMDTYAFSEDDLDLVSAIANQVTIAVQREEMQASMQEAAVFRSNLERFHSPDVVNYIMKGSKDENAFIRFLEEREVTILFADICDFTSMLEKMPPQDAADMLIDYFDEMTDVIFKYKGTVDKFIGDAIMAIFGAPISRENDAELAVQSAIEMMHRMDEFKQEHGPDKSFDIRIGVNTGLVAAGYLGSRKRIEYTVLGDPVNVAARLQDFAQPGTVIVGEETYNLVKDKFNFKARGATRLKGKRQQTQVFEVVL